METIKLNVNSDNGLIFFDGAKANTEVRQRNVEMLEGLGFQDSGVYSTSGSFYIRNHKTKASLVFGVRSNISGRGNSKYFSLRKDFSNIDEAKEFANSISLIKA